MPPGVATSRNLARHERRNAWLIGGVVIAATIAVGGWAAFVRKAVAPAPDAPAAIAVLPFVNVGADSTQEYFVDGLTDELITTLSLVDGVRVASRTSSFRFKRRDVDVREIGRRLGVTSVLEGSVRRGGGRSRVSVRLVGTENGLQRWSRVFERDDTDALEIQRDVASAIVETLKGKPGGGRQAAARGATTDPEAYDLYLRGRYFRYKRTEDGLRRAVELLTAAVKRAPEFARAHVALAESYATMGLSDMEPPRAVFPLAARAAAEALRLAPDLGSARATLGYVALYYDWDWSRAEQELRRAIDVEPNDATARQWYAELLTAMGRFDEAEREMRQAQTLDPLGPVASAALGRLLYHKRDNARAAAQFSAALELDSTFALTHLWAGQLYDVVGRSDEALASLRRAARLSNDAPVYLAALAHALATRGDREAAARLLPRIEGSRVVPSYEVAKVYLALGRRGDAMRWLERAFAERSRSMVLMRVDPQLAALRDDDGYRALLGRAGL
jgi:TolB-like protein/Flp pilus assembly protein TadD